MMDNGYAGWETWLQKWFKVLLGAALLVNAGALLIPILEPDGALYATISKTIARTGDFVNLRVDGKDWLDKPHFPFWMAAISMRIFGINAFAYKFPALLFWGVGAWYTYRFAVSLYGRAVGQLSVLVYVTAAHLVISNNDVRAEPYLTGLVIGAVYHLYKASGRDRWMGHIAAGALLAACAMMTKGFFVLITIGAGFVMDWVLRGRWDQFLRVRWWVALLLAFVFTLPELYCLYEQFDCHPEKLVFGRRAVSGLRFFFWDSQFGRFFNTGPIRGDGDPFFYFHTVLWAFLPWSLLLYAAVIQKCRGLRKRGQAGDLICLGAVLVSFAMFSLSRFQLPHYLNILFPFFSIQTAAWLYGIRRRLTQRLVVVFQQVIAWVLPVGLLGLSWFFRGGYWPAVMVSVGLGTGLVFWFFRGRGVEQAIGRSLGIALLTYGFVNFWLYPEILRYQAGSEAGKWMGADREVVYMLEEKPSNYSFTFYNPGEVRRVGEGGLDGLAGKGPVLLFVPGGDADSLRMRGHHVELLRTFPNFHISQLTGEFINYKTRERVLGGWDMVRVR